MMQLNPGLLLSKNDIPFIEAQLTIHVPTIKEIEMIGEPQFFAGANFLCLTVNDLSLEDQEKVDRLNNLMIVAGLAQQRLPQLQQSRVSAQLLLTLLFPGYNPSLTQKALVLKTPNEIKQISAEQYNDFQDIIRQMFCLNEVSGSINYNPGNARAKRMAQKFRKYHEKIAKMQHKDGGQNISIFSRYISILSVGEHKDMNMLLNYSVYQLFDQFQRFELKEASDIHQRALLAGAQNLQEVQNWMKDIHNNSDDDKNNSKLKF